MGKTLGKLIAFSGIGIISLGYTVSVIGGMLWYKQPEKSTHRTSHGEEIPANVLTIGLGTLAGGLAINRIGSRILDSSIRKDEDYDFNLEQKEQI